MILLPVILSFFLTHQPRNQNSFSSFCLSQVPFIEACFLLVLISSDKIKQVDQGNAMHLKHVNLLVSLASDSLSDKRKQYIARLVSNG